MHRKPCSIGRAVAIFVFCLVCVAYSCADNILSGSGSLPVTFYFNSGGTNCFSNCGGDIQNFGPDSLSGSNGVRFSYTFSSYSEAPLPGGFTSVSATIGGGKIEVWLPSTLGFVGDITSGTLDGYYCKRAPFDNCGQHVNGLVETTVYFSGKWIIAHYPAPEFWPAQGHFYAAEQDWYDSWVNCNNVHGCGKPPSTIWIDTRIPGTTTPEPNTLVLLGSSLVGVAGVLRRKLF